MLRISDSQKKLGIAMSLIALVLVLGGLAEYFQALRTRITPQNNRFRSAISFMRATTRSLACIATMPRRDGGTPRSRRSTSA